MIMSKLRTIPRTHIYIVYTHTHTHTHTKWPRSWMSAFSVVGVCVDAVEGNDSDSVHMCVFVCVSVRALKSVVYSDVSHSHKMDSMMNERFQCCRCVCRCCGRE